MGKSLEHIQGHHTAFRERIGALGSSTASDANVLLVTLATCTRSIPPIIRFAVCDVTTGEEAILQGLG
jgi:hypothetical protein